MDKKAKLASCIRDFYTGKWYPLLAILLVLVGHAVGAELVFFLLSMAAFALGCLFANDFRFAVTPFLSTIMFVTVEHCPNVPYYSHYYTEPLPLAVLIVGFLILIAGITVFAFRNRNRAHSIRFSGLLPCMIVLSAAFLLNGVFNPAYTVSNLVYALSFPVILVGIYLLFSCYIHFDAQSFEYFMYCLMLTGLLIAAQIGIAYIDGTVRMENGSVVKESVVLGWGVWTTVGGMQAFLMPPCFYFAATRKNGWIGYVLGLLEFLCCFLTMSRGAFLVGCGTLGLCLIVVCVAGENRKLNRILTFAVALVGIIGVAVFWSKIYSVAQKLLNSGLGDNGRFNLWRTGIDRFLSHPVFGAGFYDSGIVQDWTINVYPYFYHNTIVEMLGACGTFGILAYAWHRFVTVRLCFRRPSLYKFFLGISILSLLMFCMVDVLLFISYPLIFYVLILVFLERADMRMISY